MHPAVCTVCAFAIALFAMPGRAARAADYPTQTIKIIVPFPPGGGVAHGIGNTFYEWMGYDDGAQPVTTTFADYLLPTATEVPMLQTLYKETRSPLNPLGVKGVGEAGTIPAAAALISAVEDALAPFGVHIGHVPLSPMTIVELIRTVRQG